MNYLQFQDTDFINREGIKYININKINEQIIITNTENYFKSITYKNLCKYSHLTKIKIENITYIPELFINSYASWYSTLYYINMENLKNKTKSESKVSKDDSKTLPVNLKDSEFSNLSTSEQNENIELLKDILKSIITIKTDLATIRQYQTSNKNSESLMLKNKIKNGIDNIIKQNQPKIEQFKDDIFEEFKQK
jgi:hypothetical protein